MSKTVIVVGAGITGVASAEWLRRDGWHVTLIDRNPPGDPDQTSFGNAGLLARCAVVPVSEPGLWSAAPKMIVDPSSPLFLRWLYLPKLLPWLIPFLKNSSSKRAREITKAIVDLTDDSVDQHLTLAKGTPAEKFIRTGDYLYIYRSKKDYDADAATNALKAEYGFKPTYMNNEALKKRDPNLGDAYQFASVFPDHGWITSPGGYVAALGQHFVDNGGIFETGEVIDITAGDAPSVQLKSGRKLTADKVVLSAGAWSGNLAKKLGLNVRLETERGYHLSMFDPNIKPAQPFMVSDAKFVVTPMDGFLRAAGIVEFGGLKAKPSKAPFNLLRKQLKDVYPDLEFDHVEEWMGHRPTLPDSLPIIGESKAAPNIIHAFGGQHIGLTMGAKVGTMVRDIASDRHTNTDISPYGPDRF